MGKNLHSSASLRRTASSRVSGAPFPWPLLGRIAIPLVGITLVASIILIDGSAPLSMFTSAGPPGSLARFRERAVHFDLLLIGDSITGNRNSTRFRDELAAKLAANPLYTFEMVGPRGKRHLRGHYGGAREVREFYTIGFGSGWGTGTYDVTPHLGPPRTPDIAAIHLGTNDLNMRMLPYAPYSLDHGKTLNHSRSGELADLLALLLHWHNGSKSKKLEHIILSTIIPIRDRAGDLRVFNNELIAMAEDFAEGAGGRPPVRIAIADHSRRFLSNPDLFTGGPDDWMKDALHANELGEEQMADVYYQAIVAAIEDDAAPAAVSNLLVSSVDSTSVTLTFIAGGGDSTSGQAARYDARYARRPFDAEHFGHATQAVDEPAPALAASVDTVKVTGLLPATTYYFALKVVDLAGNRSPMSALVRSTTSGTSWLDETIAAKESGPQRQNDRL